MIRSGISAICMLAVVLSGCDRRKIVRTDTETSGRAIIAADECFTPIMKEELDVFTGLNPEAEIHPVYTGERSLFDLIASDSVRLVIAARELDGAEKAAIEEKKLTVRSQKIARDGIALIVNRENPDSLINLSLLERIMTGEITRWDEIGISGKPLRDGIKVVFDNPNSSTLRFIGDAIAHGKPLSGQLRALDSNPEVIRYVSRTPNALGVIGVNWISNPDDSTKLSFNETIRVMSVGNGEHVSPENTYKPYPAYLNNGNYPLTRDVFIILSDLRGTLPAGFVKFMAGDAGQRIILKAGLVPATRPTREVYIRDDF